MSAGHYRHGHPVDAKELRNVLAVMQDKRFRSAMAKYTVQDNAHRIIYLAGSDNAGTTVFYDKDLPETLKIGRKMVNPRQFLRWHETVEGILIRLYGFDYYKAHRWATAIERREVEKAGFVWGAYEKALRPFIHTDEHDADSSSPTTLLLEAYKGSKFYDSLKAMQRKAA